MNPCKKLGKVQVKRKMRKSKATFLYIEISRQAENTRAECFLFCFLLHYTHICWDSMSKNTPKIARRRIPKLWGRKGEVSAWGVSGSLSSQGMFELLKERKLACVQYKVLTKAVSVSQCVAGRDGSLRHRQRPHLLWAHPQLPATW